MTGCWFLVLLFLLGGCSWSEEEANNIYQEQTFGDLVEEPEPHDLQKNVRDNRESTKQRIEEQEGLSLSDALFYALDRSKSLRAQAEQIYQQDAREQSVIATLLPTVQATFEHTRDEAEQTVGGETLTPQSRSEYWFTVNQNIFTGEFAPAREAVRQSRKIAKLQLKGEREQLSFNVASAFYRILQAESDLEALQASLESAREFERIVQSRVDAGRASRDELLSARARVSEVQNLISEAEERRNAQRARLSELIGVNHQSLPDRLIDSLDPDRPEGTPSDLVARAIQSREDLAAAERQAEVAEAERNRELSGYYPDVDLTLQQWTHREGGFQAENDWTAVLGIQYTLLDGFGREARIAEAESRIRQNRLEARDLERSIEREVREAVVAFESIQESMDFQESRLEAAEEAHRVATSRFEAGSATHLDVLEAAQTRQEADRDLRRTRLAEKLAALRIYLTTGTLEQSPLFESILNPQN